jgi:cation-transporting P-type ATPase F
VTSDPVGGTTSIRDGERNAHHALAAHEVVLLLETHVDDGLSDAEAERRLGRFGPNVLPEGRTAGPFVRFLRQFHHPLIYVLLAAGAVTLVLGEIVDSSVIFGVVLVNAFVGYVQESRAEAALDALRSMIRTEARVRRGGLVRTVPSSELVPGDVVLLEAGNKVPADLRLLEVTELKVDESALTGESLPVAKHEVTLADVTPVADRHNMVYSGTLATGGTGVGVVVATGAETEFGEIHRLVGTAADVATPLTRKLAWFSKVLTVAILALAAVTFGVGLARGEPGVDMFTAAVALAVGAIPEGLPAAVTITLAIGVSRMAHRGAVVRRMPAVETLGSTTVVCADKTGTLTENQMTVRTLWTPDGPFEVTGGGYRPEGSILDERGDEPDLETHAALRWTLIAGAGCNDARLVHTEGTWQVIGDPTEGAMLVVAAKAGFDADRVEAAFPRHMTIPFSSERSYMAGLHLAHDGGRLVLVKGATERVVELCRTQMAPDGSLEPLDRERVLAAAETLAADGLRVLATALTELDPAVAFDTDALSGTLTLTGMQAMLDPPRPAAIEAVATCHVAGIDVKMITGDHATTATAIAGQLGILASEAPKKGEVLTGLDLGTLDAADYPAAVERASVFARVSPEQKLRLVEGLQAREHVVAMTGDGVNDAPALQQADIGVAMGRGGTEVAKDAADMVLVDDDFATIEAAIEEGRGVFDNLTKFIVWTLPTNMGEGLVILVAIIAAATLPILPAQILWINMTTAVALGLMLAFEPREAGIMSRPPRDPRRPLLTGALVVRILLVSALLVGGSSWLFHWEQNHGATLAEARTAAVNLFVAVEAFYLFSCRSLTQPVRRIGFFTNRWILVGVFVQAIGQMVITYLPFMNTVFQTAPIGPDTWLRILLVAAATTVVVSLDKRIGRRFA